MDLNQHLEVARFMVTLAKLPKNRQRSGPKRVSARQTQIKLAFGSFDRPTGEQEGGTFFYHNRQTD